MADKNNYLGFNFGDFSDPTNQADGVATKYLNLQGLTDFWCQIKSYIDTQDQNLFSTITSNSNKTLTIQGNGTSLGTYNGLETKTINITPESIGAAPSNHKHVNHLYKTIYLGGIEDTKGCLVKLNVEETQNAMISVKITGNSYGKLKPVFSIIEFYNYYNGGNSSQRIINMQGTHFGYDFGKINIFNYGGYIYLWFSQNGSYQSFNVFANWTNSNGVDNNVNVVDTITKAIMPTSGVSHLVEFELNKIPYGDFLPLIGGTMTGVINSQNIIPKTTNTYDLGNSSLKWANVYATTFRGNLSGNVTGNADTASKLGTSTVGSSTMPIYLNAGSPQVISSFPEAYLSNGGKNLKESYSPLDAALIPILGANRFAYANPTGIIVEYSTDGGSTWVDYGATDDMKYGLTTEGTNFKIGGPNSTAGNVTADNKLRITIDTDAASVYTTLHKFALYITTYGSIGSKVTIEKSLEETPDSFIMVAENIPIGGWPGWNIINVESFTTYGNNASYQYGLIRFTFSHDSCSSSNTGLQILKLYAYGGVGWLTPSYEALYGAPYMLKNDKTARFDVAMLPKTTNTYNLGVPYLQWNDICGKTLYEDGTSLVNKYAVKSHTHSHLTGSGAQLSATTRNLTNFPTSKTLFTGYWNASGDYATNYGTTLDISYSTWYQRLAFNTSGRIEYFRGINTNNTDGTEATLSKIGDLAYTSDIPTSLKNPYSLTIQGNGTSLGTYDGSVAKTINITPASIGAVSSSHTHTVTYTPSGEVTTTFDDVSVFINTSSGTTSVASSEHTHTIDLGELSPTFTGASTTVPATSTTGTTVASQDHTHSTDEKLLGVSYSNGILTITSAHTHAVTATSTTGTTVASQNHTHEVAVSGTISFTGDDMTTGTPSGTTNVASSGHTHTGTVTGTVTSTFIGTEDTVTSTSAS